MSVVTEVRKAGSANLDIVGGRLLDPAQGIDATTTISVRHDRIAGVGGNQAVSSDLHAHNVSGPVFDLATTLSKLLHVGMTLDDVIRASTSTPALAIRREGAIGAVAAGRNADLTILEPRTGNWELPGAAGHTEVVERLLIPRMVIKAGQPCDVSPPDWAIQ